MNTLVGNCKYPVEGGQCSVSVRTFFLVVISTGFHSKLQSKKREDHYRGMSNRHIFLDVSQWGEIVFEMEHSNFYLHFHVIFIPLSDSC